MVCVKGKVQEYYNLTQLKAENNRPADARALRRHASENHT
ncbi:Extracellular deoxyribonuclease Xds [Vibrio cholerae]|nr:Extracellular deoxyribonuclease Xds [Vibrio cholerae]